MIGRSDAQIARKTLKTRFIPNRINASKNHFCHIVDHTIQDISFLHVRSVRCVVRKKNGKPIYYEILQTALFFYVADTTVLSQELAHSLYYEIALFSVADRPIS